MPRSCVAPGCKQGYGSNPSNRSFFFVPKDPVRRAKWQAALPPRPNFELKYGQALCEKHFAPDDIIRKRVFKDRNGTVIAEVLNYLIVHILQASICSLKQSPNNLN